MALRRRGKWWYGDSQADIRDELVRVGKLNEYIPTHFADARCACGGRTFRLLLDEGTAAVRVCPKYQALGSFLDQQVLPRVEQWRHAAVASGALAPS